MNDTLTARDALHPLPTLDEVIKSYGASHVLRAALRALVIRRLKRSRPPDIRDLNAHLRRDIGLEREPEAADWRYFTL